jgi:hypothetical protein
MKVRARTTLGDLHRATPWLWLHCEKCQHHAPLACAVDDHRPGDRVAHQCWLRIHGKHRSRESAWRALQDMMASRH